MTQRSPTLWNMFHPRTFASTVERIVDALAEANLTLFARIDHAAGARDARMEMLPATVLIYGNAKGGTPIMLAACPTSSA